MHVRVLPLFAAILLAGVPDHAPSDWPFAVGETLHFTAKIGYFPAGSAELQVVRSTDLRGKPAVVLALNAKGGPPGLASSWALTSWVESASFSSLQFRRHMDLAGRVTDEQYQILPDSARYRLTGSGQDYVAPAHPMDELALLYYLRTLPLKPGDSRALRGYFQNGFNPITVTVLGREQIEVGSGATYPCLRLRVAAAGKSTDLWITDDARRIPARASVVLPLGKATLVWDGR
jgi:hypothetical protein